MIVNLIPCNTHPCFQVIMLFYIIIYKKAIYKKLFSIQIKKTHNDANFAITGGTWQPTVLPVMTKLVSNLPLILTIFSNFKIFGKLNSFLITNHRPCPDSQSDPVEQIPALLSIKLWAGRGHSIIP